MKKLVSILLALTMVISLAVGVVAVEEPVVQITSPVHIWGTESIFTGEDWFDGYNWGQHGMVSTIVDGQEFIDGSWEELTSRGYTVTCTDDQAPDNLWTIPEGQLGAVYKGHVVIEDSSGATVLDTDVDVHILTPGNYETSITLDDNTITYYADESYRGNNSVAGTVYFACGCSRVDKHLSFSNEWDWPTEVGTYEKTIFVGNSAFELPITVVVEPRLEGHALTMYYYGNGYGAVTSDYQLSVYFGGDGAKDWHERYDISYGDAIVKEWPTEVGTHTVTFEKTVTINGEEYTFTIPMTVVVSELSATSGKCGDNMTWSFNTETYTLTISGTGDMYTIAENENAFLNQQYSYEPGWWKLPVKHIVVEEGVEHLADYAFIQNFNNYYEIHETIKLPTTLKALPERCLMMSTAMTSLMIPEGITSITGWPFGYPGNSFLTVRNLYLPSTLTEMDPLSLAFACMPFDNDGDPVDGDLIIHFAGTEEQWNAIKQVTSPIMEEIFATASEDMLAPYREVIEKATILFEPKQEDEDITVDNGNASIPDSKVEITEGKDVVIDVTGTEEEVTGAVIGAETVDKIANAETSVEIKLPDAAVSFDAAAMGTIAGAAADSAITIVAKEVEETALTTEQKAALADLEVSTILTLEVLAGDTKISDFGGGKATITVPFVLPEGKDSGSYYVAYIADDGTITAMPTTYADGALTFTTTHFSDYVVLEKTTMEPPVTEPPTTEPPATEPPVSDNPQTGDSSALMMWVVLLTVSAAALVVCTTKLKAF